VTVRRAKDERAHVGAMSLVHVTKRAEIAGRDPS
jgi:hypothetical protein